MKEIKTFDIYFSSIKAGEKVYCLNADRSLVTLVLDEPKSWQDNTFKATVVDAETVTDDIYGKPLEIGRHEDQWCADVFFTFTDYPCDDETLSESSVA